MVPQRAFVGPGPVGFVEAAATANPVERKAAIERYAAANKAPR
jgi:hypothetical protein